jgi:ATP-dependent Zn protease
MRKSTAKKMKAEREAYLADQKQEALEQGTEAVQRDIVAAAAHEAGHALANTLLGIGVEYVTVERKRVLKYGQECFETGYTQPLGERKLTRETLEREAVSLLAGPAAEDWFGGDSTKGREGDINMLMQYAHHCQLSLPEARNLCDRAQRQAMELVEKHEETIKAIAIELACKQRLEGDRVREIVERADMVRTIIQNAEKSAV